MLRDWVPGRPCMGDPHMRQTTRDEINVSYYRLNPRPYYHGTQQTPNSTRKHDVPGTYACLCTYLVQMLEYSCNYYTSRVHTSNVIRICILAMVQAYVHVWGVFCNRTPVIGSPRRYSELLGVREITTWMHHANLRSLRRAATPSFPTRCKRPNIHERHL